MIHYFNEKVSVHFSTRQVQSTSIKKRESNTLLQKFSSTVMTKNLNEKLSEAKCLLSVWLSEYSRRPTPCNHGPNNISRVLYIICNVLDVKHLNYILKHIYIYIYIVDEGAINVENYRASCELAETPGEDCSVSKLFE